MRMVPAVPRNVRRSVIACRPCADLGNLSVIGHVSFICAFMSENDDFGYCNNDLLG
jgi:hypothetical protein